MIKFFVAIFLVVLFILTLVFSFNSYFDVLNIFKRVNENNKILFLESKNSNREKFLAPILFNNTNYETIMIGTSKGKFIYTPSSVGNFSIPNLNISDYSLYLNYIQTNNKTKIQKIYIAIDVEHFFSNKEKPLELPSKFSLIKRYFSWEYIKESLYQYNCNKNGRKGLNIYIEKNNIYGQKKVNSFKIKEKDEVFFNMYPHSFFEKNVFKLKKELTKIKDVEIIIIITPSKQNFLKQVDLIELKKEINNLQKDYKVLDFSTDYPLEKDYIDELHFSDEVGFDIWEKVRNYNNNNI